MIHPRYLIIVLLITTVTASGFLRDYIIVNVNQQLQHLYYATETSHVDDGMFFLKGMTYWQVYSFKWGVVLLFCTLYALQTHLLIQQVFNKSYFKPVIFSFAFLLGISGVIFGVFWLFGYIQEGYAVARYPLSWAQSPIPLMVLVPAIYLQRRPS